MFTNQIDQAARRTVRYWYIDGLNEISFGILCLILGAYFAADFAAERGLPSGSGLHFALESSFVLIIVGGGLLLNRLVKMLKNRITYPRTGYVAYRQPSKGRRRIIPAFIAAAMAVVVSLLFMNAPASLSWMPAITGVGFAGVWFYLAYRIGLLRFYLLAGSELLIGTVLSFAGIGNTTGLSLFYGLTGLAVILSGAATLVRYLRSTSGSSDPA
jgi:hypothetical protein